MAKKRVNKLEENYKRFSRMEPNELSEYRSGLDDELKEIEMQIVNKEKELEGRQAQIDITTDPNKKDVLSAQKETADQEKADLEAMKNKKLKEIRGIEDWAKNKGKIEKVMSYKDRLDEKCKLLKKDVKSLGKDIRAKQKEEVAIDKQLRKSEELTNNEYNDLMRRKEELEREIEKEQKEMAEAEKKIVALTGSVSKCDLVWKNLMMGKSWDEIHVKAVRMNAKVALNRGYTGDTAKGAGDLLGKGSDVKTGAFVSLLDKMRKNGIDSNAPTQPITPVQDNNSMTEYDEFAKKHPRLAKIRDAFKNFANKFSKDKKEQVASVAPATPTNPTISERDAFVEQLRMMTEKDYKDQIREAKEAEYVEMHKPKAKTNPDTQRGGDNNQR